MKKTQTILLVSAIVLTAFFGVFAQIRKGYAEEAEKMLNEGQQQLEQAEQTKNETKTRAQHSARDARIAMNELEAAEKVLQECQTGK